MRLWGAYPKHIICYLKKFRKISNTKMVVMSIRSFDSKASQRTTLEKLKEDPIISADCTNTRIRGILKKQMSSLHVLFNLNVTRKLSVVFVGKVFETAPSSRYVRWLCFVFFAACSTKVNWIKCVAKQSSNASSMKPRMSLGLKKANRRQRKIPRSLKCGLR
jgi:hypothetical protein